MKRGQCPISDIVKDYQWVRWNAIKSNSYIALQSAHHRMKDDDEDEERDVYFWHRILWTLFCCFVELYPDSESVNQV